MPAKGATVSPLSKLRRVVMLPPRSRISASSVLDRGECVLTVSRLGGRAESAYVAPTEHGPGSAQRQGERVIQRF